MGVLIVLLWPAKLQDAPRETEGGDEKTCPHCRSLIPEAASVCRYCQRDVPLTEKSEKTSKTSFSYSLGKTFSKYPEKQKEPRKDNIPEAHETASQPSTVQPSSFFQESGILVFIGIIVFIIILSVSAKFYSKHNSVSDNKPHASIIIRSSGSSNNIKKNLTLIHFALEDPEKLSKCDPGTAGEQSEMATRYLSSKQYKLAQQYAGSSQMYLGSCHDEDKIERIDADATLTMAKAMFARGNSDGTKWAFAAAQAYLRCSNSEKLS